MTQYKAERKLTKNERLDIATMVYFIPSNVKSRIYLGDKIKMADLSSRGVKPMRVTPGYILLQWGKTYRDEQITSYRRDISLGLITKAELLESMPMRFRDWLWSKIKDVPYDVGLDSTRMFVELSGLTLNKDLYL